MIGGVTLNALIYGLLSAMASRFARRGQRDARRYPRLERDDAPPPGADGRPGRAGSVAWSYLPRTTAALAEIREAQMARGYRPRGIRDAAPLVIPLLAGGLERSMIPPRHSRRGPSSAPCPRAGPPPVAACVTPGRTCYRSDGCLLSRPGSASRCRRAVGGCVASLMVGLFTSAVASRICTAPLSRSHLGAARVDRQRRRPGRPGGRDRGAISRLRSIPLRALSLFDPPAISLPLLAVLGLLLVPAAVLP